MESQKSVYDVKLFDVPDYKDLYKITKDGRVWDCVKERWLQPRVRSYLHRYYGKVNGCIGLDNKDFLCVTLVKDKRYRTFNIHRLMAETFLDNKHKYKFVHHINYNRADNNINNLAWVDAPINKKKKLFVKKAEVWEY